MTSKSLIALIVGAGTAILCAPAQADTRAGVDAWTRGDHARAVKEWQADAARGDPDALFNLGQARKLGKGLPQDLAKAEELFGRAAAQGHLQAADNYGLLLFQRGERERALPFVRAAADRGDPRAQYLLGLAHFNGDMVPKDWRRAYALVSLARQQGLAQAAPALQQMDQYIPLAQRQEGVAMAGELQTQADATRARQLAAVDLGAQAPPAPTIAAPAAERDGPGSAGADYTLRKPAKIAPVQPAAPPASAVRPAPAGKWRVQLGAFGLSANADALWNRVKGRAELAGHPRINVTAGKIVKLQAGGFASQAEAQAACARLKSAGIECAAVPG